MTMLVEANKAGSEKSRVRVQALWLQSVLTRSMDTKGIYWFCSLIFFSWTIQWEKSKPMRHITPRPVALKPSWLSMWHSPAFSPGLYICSSCGRLHEENHYRPYTYATELMQSIRLLHVYFCHNYSKLQMLGENTFRLHNMLKLILLHIQGYFNFRFDIC